MSLREIIETEINHECSLNKEPYCKEKNFIKVIKIMCFEFLKIEENIITNTFSKKIKKHLEAFKFVNDEYSNKESYEITPNYISELYYYIFYSTNNESSKKNGVFYTLNSYAYNFTKELMYKYLCKQCNISEEKDNNYSYKIFKNINKSLLEEVVKNCKILDLGCGTGNLIFNMIVNINELIEEIELKIQLKDIIYNCTAIDMDNMSIKILKIRIFLYLSKIKGYCYINELNNILNDIDNLEEFRHIYKADVLEELNIEKEYFNIIISNPPYVKVEKCKIKNYIEYYEITSANHYDLTYIFIHKIMEYIKYCGIVGIITKNTYLQNDSAESIRKILYNEFTIISCKEEKDIFNTSVQAVIVSTILQKVSNKIILEMDKTINNNRIYSLDSKYKVSFVKHKVMKLKEKLLTIENRLDNYFDITRNGKGTDIINKNICKYYLNDDRYKFDYSELGLIIIPSECQINRFAAIDLNLVDGIGKSTINIKPNDKNLELNNFIFFICLLNSDLIYFWMILNGKFNSKNALRITVDLIKNIPVISVENKKLEEIARAFRNYINNNGCKNNFHNKINDIIYEIYTINKKEIYLIENFIKEYEANAVFSEKFKK